MEIGVCSGNAVFSRIGFWSPKKDIVDSLLKRRSEFSKKRFKCLKTVELSIFRKLEKMPERFRLQVLFYRCISGS